MRKRYYAYVVKDMVNYFEEKLLERKDKITVLKSAPAISESGTPCVYYELEAENGEINSKWELKEERDPV